MTASPSSLLRVAKSKKAGCRATERTCVGHLDHHRRGRLTYKGYTETVNVPQLRAPYCTSEHDDVRAEAR